MQEGAQELVGAGRSNDASAREEGGVEGLGTRAGLSRGEEGR